MTWRRDPTSRRLRPERVPWYLIAGTSVVFLVLIVASSINYSAVTQAKANAYLDPSYQVIEEGTTAQGVLTETGSVTLRINLSVVNPSPRLLYFESISYKSWIGGGKSQAPFFLSIYGSEEISPVPIPAWSNTTLPLSFTLSRATDPYRFESTRSIEQAEANVSGIAAALEWRLYLLIGLPIDGVPAPLATAADYELNINRIVLSWGTDLGT